MITNKNKHGCDILWNHTLNQIQFLSYIMISKKLAQTFYNCQLTNRAKVIYCTPMLTQFNSYIEQTTYVSVNAVTSCYKESVSSMQLCKWYVNNFQSVLYILLGIEPMTLLIRWPGNQANWTHAVLLYIVYKVQKMLWRFAREWNQQEVDVKHCTDYHVNWWPCHVAYGQKNQSPYKATGL